MITGNGTCRKKIARNAAAAISHSVVSFNERREMRSKASSTIARTAALMPVKRAAATGSEPYSAYKIESARMTAAPGNTNNKPATSPPLRPCSRHPA